MIAKDIKRFTGNISNENFRGLVVNIYVNSVRLARIARWNRKSWLSDKSRVTSETMVSD